MRYRVTRMGLRVEESEHQEFDDEQSARQAFEALGDVPKQLCIEKSGGVTSWRRLAGWCRVSGRLAHAECVDNYNETIDCGIDRGSCSDPRCALREVS